MQRYQPSLAWIDNDAFAHADEDADGDFVLYADAKSAIDAAARENARLRAVVEAARDALINISSVGYPKDPITGRYNKNCTWDFSDCTSNGNPADANAIGSAFLGLSAALSALDAKGGG